MTSTITVPASLDDLTFEQVISQVAAVSADEELLVDARRCTWASPYGLTALLTLAQTRAVKPLFLPPDLDDLAAYWSRVGFFRHAEELFVLMGRIPTDRRAVASAMVVEITKLVPNVAAMDELSGVLTHVNEIFRDSLSLESRTAMRLTMVVSEACQNVIEHAGCSGWLMLQVFNYRKRMGRSVAVLAVADAGRSYWDSKTRRTGLDALGGRVASHNGKLSVRSGTKRRSIVPAWDDDLPLMEHLAPFPGTQVQITIPADILDATG